MLIINTCDYSDNKIKIVQFIKIKHCHLTSLG